jgi:putative ABC transport system permease protein
MHENDDNLPRWSQVFLKTICPDYLCEEIEGDLLQKYRFDVERYGERTARKKLIWNILSFFHPVILLRNKFSMPLNQTIMLKNYLVTALRVSKRQKLYTLINAVGLSVGLSCALLIGIYIADELSYDRYMVDGERIYRVGINETFKGDEILYSDTPAPLADAMRHELPNVEDVVRVSVYENPVRRGDHVFTVKRFMSADSNFFAFFGYKLLEGNAGNALKGPHKIVLTLSAAKKYFDYDGRTGESPIGKQILVGRQAEPAQVTGIINDPPSNTHMKFDMILSSESIDFSRSECWPCYGMKTYFKTMHQSGTADVEKKLEEFAQTRIIPSLEKDLNISHDQFVKSGDMVKFFIDPLLSIHLESNIDSEFEPNGDIRYVYILGAIGIFLVLVACINFMNLATARAINRGKEVGVRKTMGATRGGLVPQFMIESFLHVGIAGVLAMVLAVVALAPFNELSGKALSIDLLIDPTLIGYVLLGLFIVGVLAGAYPSFYLSAFNPVAVLKAGRAKGESRSYFRSSLVVFQFTISIVMIIGTMMVYKQVQYIRNHDLGFEKENILRLKETFALGENFNVFKEELLSHSEFLHASYAVSLPPNINSTTFLRAEHSEQLVGFFVNTSDYDLVETMGYQMKHGRYFSRDFPSDTSAVVINEAGARLLGFDTSEGKRIGFNEKEMFNVIGIVRDFNFASLKSSVQPMAIFLNKNVRRHLVARIGPGDPSEKIDLAHTIWNKYAAGAPFEYSFIDDDYDQLFRAEQRLGIVFTVFTILAIFIACLGLFGLITYIASQRTKEIGIRKVLGATAGQLTLLLLSDLMRLVVISLVIAIPIAWYGMDQWLQSFAYRTNFDVFSALIAGLSGLMIALVTVGFRSLRAASVNPVDSLKNE